ncbi:hypothetical protein EPD60_06130 [Flaviaesturariibacter flavus]|uniref:RHS repeat-associated core domain-containing protein n=1 Tax=Flaviaesturariibacter flavus TaxID=2502780 RepID=A0A4R1BK97_9BACT|nr:hypothetical protein [Flaviaesturariibacter flavus]TCJ17763.1 hypothetical protein EPD60_06130 [Flaviaesturariibacter flavus]
MNRFLLFLALLASAGTVSAQGTISMVSTYQCVVPATAATESDELDSVVLQYATEGRDTLSTTVLRYERASGKLLEKQVALSDIFLKRIGYTGGQRPYFYQYRYDNEGRIIYHSDAITGRYQIMDYNGENAIVKTFDAKSRRLLNQDVMREGALVAKRF